MSTTITEVFKKAFGYKYLFGIYKKGHVFNCELVKDNIYHVTNPAVSDEGVWGDGYKGYIWMTLAGNFRTTNLNDNTFVDRGPGFCNVPVDPQSGTNRIEVTEDNTAYICFSYGMNIDKTPQIPRCEYSILRAGESKTFELGERILLASGTLQMQNRTVESQKAIHFKTNSQTGTALTDCFLLKFL